MSDRCLDAAIDWCREEKLLGSQLKWQPILVLISIVIDLKVFILKFI